MDKISLQAMEFYGYHGVFPEERKLGQRFVVHIDMYLDLQAAGLADDLAQTVNYALVCDTVRSIVEGKPFQLIEALAEHIARSLLETYTKISEITIKVIKPAPPFPVHFAGAAVEIRRKRASDGNETVGIG